jgi:hypothetical protein
MAEPEKQTPLKKAERLAGFVVYAATLAGLSGLVFGFIAILSHNWGAAGPLFIAAAVAFGLLANAILRD